MGRPSRIEEQRRNLLPVVARAFNDLGYRGATTAEIARRCGVRENILYRLWKDKKAMFIASIDHVYERTVSTWMQLGSRRGGFSPTAVLEHESEHLGEFGNHRIIFSGLGETDDPDIRAALSRMYRRFQAFIAERMPPGARGPRSRADADISAWAMIGLGTVFTIGRELGILSPAARKRLLASMGKRLLED